MNTIREEHGRPLALQGGPVVAADIVAKLAGISLSTAVRAIAALSVVKSTTGIPADKLISFEDTPLALPDEVRAHNTLQLYEAIAEQAEPDAEITAITTGRRQR